ncbi:MAG: 4-alpha-glucanotransferase [Cyanobacteria bacterium]|nr:4-alpha-glucanotransferase [Cyanobacteriota bacterium]
MPISPSQFSSKSNAGNHFGRALSADEQVQLSQTMRDALQLLGKDHFSLIIHGSSFPADENADTGYGTPYGNAAQRLLNFSKTLGFNSLQLGPSGITKPDDPSPYMGTSFSSTPLFIDLVALARDPQWHQLLSEETLQEIIHNNPGKNTASTAYGYFFQASKKALAEVGTRFQAKKAQLPDLVKELDTFVKANQTWLERDALYEVLSEIHGSDYWPQWKSAQDRNLFNTSSDAEVLGAKTRIAELKQTHAGSLETYYLTQFIAAKQRDAFVKQASANGVKLLADRQVAFSDRDVWGYQNLFLPGYQLGCPPDYFSKTGQAWGFPVLNPDQLFTPDGKPGPAAALLESLFDKILTENPGGVRIDHIVGLIDPWVYPEGKGARPEDGGARLYSSPESPVLSKYSRVSTQEIDDKVAPEHVHRVKESALSAATVSRYSEIVQLILARAAAKGIPKEAMICEDLGTLTNPVKAVMANLQLPGIRVTQFADPNQNDHLYRGKNVEPRHWITPGTHDNAPISAWALSLPSDGPRQAHASALAAELSPDQDPAPLRDSLLSDPTALVRAKIAELFASPSRNVQIFFADLFGMDTVYNKPGTKDKQNWSLRLPPQFEAFYLKQLQDRKAINLPAVLRLALNAKGQGFVQAHQALSQALERWAKILEAPDNQPGA